MTGNQRLTVGAMLVLALTVGYVVGVATTHRGSSKPGAADIGFSQDMSVHHAQAVTMAQEALTRSTTRTVLTLARQILVRQSSEQGTMTGWLDDWAAPRTPSGAAMSWMSADGGASMPGMGGGVQMPGMATQAQLDRLAQSTGTSFDVLFLQLMIRQHQGGIVMARAAVQRAQLAEVRNLAKEMIVDETQDDAIMIPLLDASGAAPLPFK